MAVIQDKTSKYSKPVFILEPEKHELPITNLDFVFKARRREMKIKKTADILGSLVFTQ